MGQSIRKFGELPAQNAPALGGKVVFDIPVTADLENLMIALRGTVTLSAVAAALKTDGIANLIESVELIGDGRDSIVTMPFSVLCNGNMFRRKNGNVPSTTQPLLTVATHAFEVEGMLDLAAFAAVRPKDSSLRENAYKTLQVVVRFAASFIGSVYTTGTVSASTLAIDVRAKETIELADHDGRVTAPVLRALQSYREDVNAGAVTRQRFRLTPEQGLRGLTFRVIDSTGNVLSDTPLSRVRVYVGKDLRADMSASVIKESTKSEFAGTILTGYYFIDFADGNGSPDKLADCLDLRREATGGADAYVEYDTSVACTVGVRQDGFQTIQN